MKKTLLWVSVLPCAVLGSFILYSLNYWTLWAMSSFIRGWSDGLDYVLQLGIMGEAQLFTGFGFVCAGTLVAPSHKKETAITLGILGLILGIIGAIFSKEDVLTTIVTAATFIIGLTFGVAEMGGLKEPDL